MQELREIPSGSAIFPVRNSIRPPAEVRIFMANVPKRIQAVRANDGSDKHLQSAVASHHNRNREDWEPRWEWHVADTAKTVDELDAKKNTVEDFDDIHNVVVGPQ